MKDEIDQERILNEATEAAGIFSAWRRYFTIRYNETTQLFFSDRSEALGEIDKRRRELAEKIESNGLKEQKAVARFLDRIRNGAEPEDETGELATIWGKSIDLKSTLAHTERMAQQIDSTTLAARALDELKAAISYAQAEQEALTRAENAAAALHQLDGQKITAKDLKAIEKKKTKVAQFIHGTTTKDFAAWPVRMYEETHGPVRGCVSDPEKLNRILKAITATPEEIRLRF